MLETPWGQEKNEPFAWVGPLGPNYLGSEPTPVVPDQLVCPEREFGS